MLQIKTLIIDDEANARSAIKICCCTGSSIDNHREAANASKGWKKIKLLQPGTAFFRHSNARKVASS